MQSKMIVISLPTDRFFFGSRCTGCCEVAKKEGVVPGGGGCIGDATGLPEDGGGGGGGGVEVGSMDEMSFPPQADIMYIIGYG